MWLTTWPFSSGLQQEISYSDTIVQFISPSGGANHTITQVITGLAGLFCKQDARLSEMLHPSSASPHQEYKYQKIVRGGQLNRSEVKLQ